MNIVGIRKAVKALGALDADEQAAALAWHRDKTGPTKRRKYRRSVKAVGTVAKKSHHKKPSAPQPLTAGPIVKGKDALLAEAGAAGVRQSKPRLPKGPGGENSDES